MRATHSVRQRWAASSCSGVKVLGAGILFLANGRVKVNDFGREPSRFEHGLAENFVDAANQRLALAMGSDRQLSSERVQALPIFRSEHRHRERPQVGGFKLQGTAPHDRARVLKQRRGQGAVEKREHGRSGHARLVGQPQG